MVRTRRIAALGAVVALAAACGTTANKNAAGHSGSSGGSTGGTLNASGGQSTTTSGAGGALSSTGGAAGTGGSSSGGGGTSGSGSGGSGTGTGGGGAPTGGGSAPTSKFVSAAAPGVTNQTVYIGLTYSSNEGAADKAIGVAGAAPSYDMRNVWNATIAYANSHGGFAGRKLSPIYYDISVTGDVSTQEQAACANFTQDHKVFAIGVQDDIMEACAQNAGAIALGSGGATEATFQKYPHMVDPDGIAVDRLGSLTVNGLYKAGYFSGKLGLITWDNPSYRAAVTNGYLPALASHHITPAQIAYISVPQQVGAVADMSAAVGSAVTKFKSLGIDHVIIQDGAAGVWAGDGLTLEFMDQAKSQAYYPRYGQNGDNNPGTSLNPSDEQNNALAISQVDYDPSYDAGWHQNPARTACFQLQGAAGYPVSSSNVNDEVTASTTCDLIFFLQRVVNGLSAITADGFAAQAQTLGTSYPTAVVYGTKFMSGRRDGADEVRTEQYSSACSCLKFQGGPYYPD
ncbi:MAG TPA: hypothetical protein VFH50_01735 [Acidimicrobiales bacterium]|nr:hypothetical protein [Acidimicrobiales bacterium]